jgi:histidinol-phosphate aminotransferase
MSVEASATVGPPPGMRVRLSSNESAWGPSPAAVQAAVEAAAESHRYPDDQSIALRQALADAEGRSLDQVAVGHGSAALLMDLIQQVCHDGGDVVSVERAFIVYRLAARNAGVPYLEAPTGGPAKPGEPGYARDPDALLARITPDTRIVVVDNPGNPTGAHFDADGLRHIIEQVPDHVLILVDEAYHHFATNQRGYLTVDQLGVDHPGLMVMRTFSKAYGLAGLRVGYLLGPAEHVAPVDAWRTRFNVTAVSQAAAIAALDDTAHLDRVVAGTLEGRQRMEAWLAERGHAFTPSLGNFVTIELGGPADPIIDAFAQHGVGVRGLPPYGMTEQIRVTVGTEQEVEDFLEAADVVLG